MAPEFWGHVTARRSGALHIPSEFLVCGVFPELWGHVTARRSGALHIPSEFLVCGVFPEFWGYVTPRRSGASYMSPEFLGVALAVAAAYSGRVKGWARREAVDGETPNMKTKRKAEAGASQNCMEAALLCAPLGVVITDETGRIRRANPKAAALYGAPSVEALAGTPAIPAEDAANVEFAEILSGRAPVRRRISGQTAFNVTLACECVMTPFGDEGIDPKGMVFFFSEDAAGDYRGQDLIQAEKLSALENVIAGVAHEMNNPLTAILGYTELLLSRTPESITRHRLASIAEEAERCRKIVSNLMIFCTHHRRPTAPVDVNSVLQEVAGLCGYQMRVSNVKLELELEPGLPTVSADAHELEKVFLNLAVNAHQALKQVPEDARRLRIGTCSSGGTIRISFSDSGPGIPRSIRHRVFDPFFSTKPLGEGMGLGLSVAHGVAQEYGGRIWLESTEGEGTTFILELPVSGSLEGF